MPLLLPVSRAARLVGVSRKTLQKKIQDGELSTFEGLVRPDDLLRLYPDARLSNDTEFERIQNIKAQAFGRRVRERLLPSADVLLTRLATLADEHALTRSKMVQYKSIIEEIVETLSTNKNGIPRNAIDNLLGSIKTRCFESPTATTSKHNLITRDTILRIMSTHITIRPSGHEYWLEGNDTLLDAGVQAGLSLDYGCASGNCGLCKARLVSGEVSKIRHHDYVLSEAEKSRHYILMCSCTAITDVVIEALEATDENDIPTQEITTKIKHIDLPTNDMLVLHIQTPRTQRMRFLAGQSATLSVIGETDIHMPIASCPCDDRNLFFHIKRQQNDGLNDYLFNRAKKGDEIIITGPHGNFLFKDSSPRSPIFIAYGIGFAPIKSLIEHAMAVDNAEEMYLYWIVDHKEELYAHNLCRSWGDALEDFHYQAIIDKDPLAEILAQHPNISQYDVYIVGQETRANIMAKTLTTAGLTASQLYTEIID